MCTNQHNMLGISIICDCCLFYYTCPEPALVYDNNKAAESRRGNEPVLLKNTEAAEHGQVVVHKRLVESVSFPFNLSFERR